jgi:hypothetical protein
MNEKWVNFYHRAALERDGKKMPKRIVAARQAIGERLQDSTEPEERHRIEDALRGLDVLAAETLEAEKLRRHRS